MERGGHGGPSQALRQHWQDALKRAAQAGLTLQDFALLTDFGLPCASSVSVPDLAQARRAAQALGYPLVAKIDAPDVAHKSDLGGVILGIQSDEALQAAVERLQAIAPGPVLLQQQLSGTELILGMKHDPQFGPIFTLGCGGIFVELLKDYATLLPGDSRQCIAQHITQLKSYPLLAGARGRPVADLAALVEVIERFMTLGLSLQDGLSEIEINPLLVDGARIAAVDLLVIPRMKEGL